jgi:hypothetical protein
MVLCLDGGAIWPKVKVGLGQNGFMAGLGAIWPRVKMGLGLDGFMAGWGAVWPRVKVGLGLDGFMVGWGCRLAYGEGWFGPGWVYGWMGVPFGPG